MSDDYADYVWREFLRRLLERDARRRDGLRRRLASLKTEMKEMTTKASLDIPALSASYDNLLAETEAIEKQLMS
jgi:hypothetical protein